MDNDVQLFVWCSVFCVFLCGFLSIYYLFMLFMEPTKSTKPQLVTCRASVEPVELGHEVDIDHATRPTSPLQELRLLRIARHPNIAAGRIGRRVSDGLEGPGE